MRIRIKRCTDLTHSHRDMIGEELEVAHELKYGSQYICKYEENKYIVIPKIDCEIIIPSNHGKAITLLALTEDIYEKKLELIEKLLNDIDSLNEKLSFFNQSLKS